MSLEALREDYRRRLFEQYLPFWEKGGYDRQRGGFMCELNDDGSVASDEKFIWYQGRALWVYAFLYNNFGKNQHWLDIATRTRDFMVRHMYAGEGKWNEKVHRDGTLLEGVGKAVYSWLFAAGGLAQYYAAAGNPKDLELAKQSISAAARPTMIRLIPIRTLCSTRPLKSPTKACGLKDIPWSSCRSLSQLLGIQPDPQLAKLQQHHVDLIVKRFWNADYGIANEYLQHDYSRIPGAESHTFAGHSLETLWIVMHEALRVKDRACSTRPCPASGV